ncbi:MAG: hypothetical protein LIR22_05995, partial [Bacillota bacterium]|nr:hypothetical protein [Bacillota bacterium]
MIKARKFVAGDATAVAQLIATYEQLIARIIQLLTLNMIFSKWMLPFSSKKRSKRIFMFLLMLRELSGL